MTTLPKRGLKTSQYKDSMDKKDLKKLSKSQLIKMLLKRDIVNKPIPPQESVKLKPVLRKSVTEDLILPPPEKFQDRYKPIPKPRTDRPLQMQNARRPPKPPREPSLPPTPKHEFNFDDDIFQTEN